MGFNLLTSAWLPVRRISGARNVIRPCDVTQDFETDPIVALDFGRPDWNAALTEWLIGLYYLTIPPESSKIWSKYFEQPPKPEDLMSSLQPLVPAFDFDGDGPAAYQDFDPLAGLEQKSLQGLFIDAPGKITIKKNTDLFIKRQLELILDLPSAAAALITLQTYAPSGGAGHRTSLRGGGPLTMLLSPVRAGNNFAWQPSKVSTLWDRVWANMPEFVNSDGLSMMDALPWMAATRTSEKGKAVTAPQGQHPALAFFACPRRIRMIFADEGNERVAVGYRTQNYGANYEGWQHPLSPYRLDPKSGKLPLHPNAGASDYGDWLAWSGLSGDPAEPMRLWRERHRAVRGSVARTMVEAMGYDMDNAKARQWLEARLPWIDAQESSMRTVVEQCISAADAAARSVRSNVKLALYGQSKDGGYRLPDTLPKDALPEPADQFWRETQQDFESLLMKFQTLLADGGAQTAESRTSWLKLLRRHALRIFDAHVDMEALGDAEPRRLLWARGKLNFEFADHPKAGVRKQLGLSATPNKATLLDKGKDA